jgi:hypothetical protein
VERFYLGTHEPSWLRRTAVPLFYSAVRLRRYRRIPRARGRWALDSGGFSQLQAHDRWTGTDAEYASEVRAWVDQVGLPDFAAPRDWMCEPYMLAKTGKTVAEHQALTIESVVTLRAIAPYVPWLPVLQGWHVDDYLSHIEQYRAAGICLTREESVGVGSVCRRQSTREGGAIFNAIARAGIAIHAFGVKVDGLKMYGHRVRSADSLTWSFVARKRRIRMDGCTHATCANCFRWAHEWRRTRIAPMLPATGQLALALGSSSSMTP